MPKTIKYTGTQRRWPELAVTGKQSIWNLAQQEERSDAEANLLLATGLFTEIFALDDLPLSSLVSGAGNYSELNVDCVVFGLQLQQNTGSLLQFFSAGEAYFSGAKRSFLGQAVTCTATSDNYIDAHKDGYYIVTPVTISGTYANSPPMPPDCQRVCIATTNGAGVTALKTSGKDSLGNPIRNLNPRPTCRLGGATTQALTGGVKTAIIFDQSSWELQDNAYMHSVSDNPSWIKVTKSGDLKLSGFASWTVGGGGTSVAVTIQKNGGTSILVPTDTVLNASKSTAAVGIDGVSLVAGEYLQLFITAQAATNLTSAMFSATLGGGN